MISRSESQVFIVDYKSQAGMDTSFFYCPYIPFVCNVTSSWSEMTGEERAEVQAKINTEHKRYTGPTKLQQRIMKSVQQQPMLRKLT